MVLAAVLAALAGAGGDLRSRVAADYAEVGCDCCPDETPRDSKDCCDTDGGMCCCTGVTGALFVAGTATCLGQALAPMLETRALTPTHLLLPRAHGPPPTPPPIG